MADRLEHQRIGAEIIRSDPSNDPFAAAVRATRMPMLITDPHQSDNPIIFVNAAFSKLTGYDHDEIIGRNCRFLQGPETDRSDLAKIRDAVANRVPIEIDLLNYTKTGQTFWNRLLISPVFDRDGDLTYFFASQFDVTLEREHLRQLTETLKKRERTLDALVRSSSEIRFRVSADWSTMLQLAGGDLLADTAQSDPQWKDAYLPRSANAPVEAEIARAVRTLSTFSLEHQVIRADGSVGWVASRAVPLLDEHGALLEWYGAASDITLRKHAEIASRDLNVLLGMQMADRTAELRLYGDIVQSSAAPICAFDRDCRLIAFNTAHSDEFFRIFGYRVQIGDVFPDLFPPDQSAIMRGFMNRALTGECYTVTEEFGDPDLAKPYWEVSYSPLRDADGRVIGAFHYAKDITERLRTQAELATTQEALRQSQKMEAVGQLTGGVAHDFNNMLTIIRSSVDFLRRPDLPEARRTRYMDAVSETVDRAAKLTGQLLAFARRQALKPEVLNVGERLRNLAEMLNSVTGARVQVTTETPDEPCFVRVDIAQFETALVNLAVNARDAMDGEGVLTLRLVCGASMPPIRGHGGGPGPFAKIALTDTGSGIPEADLGRIFEPFFTTKEVGKGTGLGLSQVFGFAKQSGGDIEVVSAVGQGTTFSLYLPEVAAERDHEEVSEDTGPVPNGNGQRVLVVEDNLEVGRFATQILEDLGYRTEWVTNAETALERLGANGNAFEAVFSDVIMPGMGGIALAETLRQRLPAMPVLLASGYSHVLAENDAHGFELLHKPYSADQLSRILRRVTQKRLPRHGP